MLIFVAMQKDTSKGTSRRILMLIWFCLVNVAEKHFCSDDVVQTSKSRAQKTFSKEICMTCFVRTLNSALAKRCAQEWTIFPSKTAEKLFSKRRPIHTNFHHFNLEQFSFVILKKRAIN